MAGTTTSTRTRSSPSRARAVITHKWFLASFTALLTWASAAQAVSPVISCEALASIGLPNVTITRAATIPAGSFTAANGQTFTDMPDFCLVHGVAAPTAESVINFEVWMPVAIWNGRFNGVGNGALAGTISYSAMAPVVRQGYASASTDTGHTSTEPRTWLLSRERLIDYSYRGLHLTTQHAKALIAAFYGSPPNYSYYTGCSTGGKQGLMEAQRFPEDYDGVIAGDAANDWTKQMDAEVWGGVVTFGPEHNLPIAKLPLINNAVLLQCAGNGGGLPSDTFLTNPDVCTFDPGVLQCAGADAPTCLTPGQVDAVRKLYQGPTNPRTGEQEYPGLPRGSEVGWGPAGGQFLINRSVAQGSGVSSYDWFRYAVFNNPSWNYTTFNFDTDVALNETFAPITNSTDPNLDPFRALGHKLLLYHGYADPLIPPENTIAYYESVADRLQRTSASPHGLAGLQRAALQQTQEFARLFLVPGMYHCVGGPGPTTFNLLQPVVDWVENQVAPREIIASHVENGVTTFTRPLCAYPEAAFYNGSVDHPRAAPSFSCRTQ
jgi:feruloyl esterase